MSRLKKLQVSQKKNCNGCKVTFGHRCNLGYKTKYECVDICELGEIVEQTETLVPLEPCPKPLNLREKECAYKYYDIQYKHMYQQLIEEERNRIDDRIEYVEQNILYRTLKNMKTSIDDWCIKYDVVLLSEMEKHGNILFSWDVYIEVDNLFVNTYRVEYLYNPDNPEYYDQSVIKQDDGNSINFNESNILSDILRHVLNHKKDNKT